MYDTIASLTRLALRLSYAAIVAVPLAAQGPVPATRPADAPRPYRLGLDLLAGAWLPRFDESSIANTTSVASQSRAGGALAARLRLPVGRSAWSILVGGSLTRAGSGFTTAEATFPVAVPERDYRLEYRDVTAGVERAWRLGDRTALLTAIEGGIGWYRARATACRETVQALRTSCADAAGLARLNDWGPTLAPSLGVQHQVSPNAALALLVRPVLLNADNLLRWSGQQAPASIVAGVRLGPSPLRRR
jgi:hypothetical protein